MSYCNEKLEIRPTRKKKCLSCGNFIFVKKRPIDRKEVLLKEEEMIPMEKQWNQYYLNKKDIDLSEDKLYIKVKSRMPENLKINIIKINLENGKLFKL